MTALHEAPAVRTPTTRQTEVTLPIGYTDGSGHLHKQVLVRKMTGRDEALLADPANQRNGGRLVSALLESCVRPVGDLPPLGRRDIDAMYSVDRNFLLIKLRSLTFGPDLAACYTCPSCGDRFETIEDLDELPTTVLPAGELPEDIAVELRDGYLDKDGSLHTSMILRLARGDDESAAAPQMRKNASLGKNALLARCLRRLGDMPQHRVEALGTKIFADLTLGDRRLIDKAFNDAAPGIDLIRELDCPACGHAIRASLDMTNFLAPE
jgi:DNA-directed RNA polymerase subunit RPC12/RpoP